ncbi:MAG: serine/threonine protein kinase [Phycisphaerae bacterium]|nr:serine/threonine protein kinase [Phycisphaerae bacterium]
MTPPRLDNSPPLIESCLDDETLERLIAEDLRGDASQAAHDHLRRCTACAARAEESGTDERLLASLRTELPDHIAALRASVRAVADGPVPWPARWPVIEGFRIVRLIGEGGSARVFEAVELRPHRRVAIRVLREPRGDGPRSRDESRFAESASILARHRHPGLPVVFAVGSTRQGEPFMAMEYCDGEPLDLVAPSLSPIARLTIVRELAAVLAHCHSHGIAHGDVKPRNILIGADHSVKLVDFGLARSLEAGAIDLTCSIRGTPAYLSPERFDGGAVDEASDLFALGVVASELLVGEHPHLEVRRVGWAEAARAASRPPRWTLRERMPTLSLAVASLLDALLSQAPAKRPQAAVVAEALTVPATAIRRRGQGILNRRRFVAAAGLGLLMVGLAVLASTASNSRPPAPSPAALKRASIIALSPDLVFDSYADLVEAGDRLRGESASESGRSRTASNLSLVEEALGNFDAAAALIEPEVMPAAPRAKGRVRRGEIISTIRLARIRVGQQRLSDAASLLGGVEAPMLDERRARQQLIVSEFHSTRALLLAAQGEVAKARDEAATALRAARELFSESGARAEERPSWFLFQRAEQAWNAVAARSGSAEDRQAAVDAATLR